MILYSITLSVNPEVHDEWLKWVQTQFLPSVMLSGHFVEKRMLKLLNEELGQGITYSIQLLSPTLETLQEYVDTKEDLLEKPLRDKFGKHFVEFRTYLELVE
jgi:hypothetical protein